MSKVGLLMEDLDKEAKEKRKVSVEKEDRKYKNQYAEKFDRYLIRKYQIYIQIAINRLENIGESNPFFKDNEFNAEKQRKKMVDTLYIDEKELFKLFIKKLEGDNIHEIDTHLYKQAVKKLLESNYHSRDGHSEEDCFPRNFFIERIKVNSKSLFRVIF